MTIISTPSELITAVPFLLDAHPDNALVVIALREGAITCALRADIPEAVTLERSDELFASLRTSDPEELLLLAYLPTPHDRQRCERLCEELQARAEEIAPVKDFLIVQSNRWRSFLCKDQRCCDPNGQQLPDIQSSAIAAEHVFQGRMMPSGLGAHAGARSDDGEVALQLLCQAQERVVASAPELRSKQGVVALLRLISSFTIGKTIDNHELAAAALVALTDIQVRDFAIGSHGDEHLHLHLSLWSDLLAIAPAGYRAPVATVLAQWWSGRYAMTRITHLHIFCKRPLLQAGRLRRSPRCAMNSIRNCVPSYWSSQHFQSLLDSIGLYWTFS